MIMGLVVALPEEISTLTQESINPGCCAHITKNILVAHSGTGPKNAQAACRLLIAHGATHIISWGCAAALDPILKPGDLTLPETLISDNNQHLSAMSSWYKHTYDYLSKHYDIASGPLTESHKIVSSGIAKGMLHHQTKAIALDMESVAVAQSAVQAGLPFLVIRTIVDPVQMNLPKVITQAMNTQGIVEIKKLLCLLTQRPQEIPSLIKLGFYFRAARNKLVGVAKHLNAITSFDQDIVPNRNPA